MKTIDKVANNMFNGFGGKLEFYSNYSKGWNLLNIPSVFKTSENYQTYCHYKYLCLDADAIFLHEVAKHLKQKTNENKHKS